MGTKPAKKAVMTPREIRAAFILRGVTMKDIADSLGVTKGFVSQVTCGRCTTPYVQQAIAKALDMPRSSVFPKRRPVRRTRRVTTPE